MLTYNYITPLGENRVKFYKYKGGDLSILYKHVTGPLAQWCVDHVIPPSIAPNMITLWGILCTVIPHVLIAMYTKGQLEGDVPRWLCFFTGFMTLMYSNFDNMDGKQARKTGSSSPLGLLFDHGCDALNVTVTALNIFTITQQGSSFATVVNYFLFAIPFYTGTWEEYYTGELVLGPVNGASEGVFFVGMLFIFSGLVGCEFWLKPSILPGWQNRDICLIIIPLVSLFTFVPNLLKTFKHIKPKKYPEALKNLLPVFMSFFTGLFIHYYSVAGISIKHCRLFLYFFGFNFGKLMTQLQLAHVADEEFNGFRKTTTIYYVILVVIVALGERSKIAEMSTLYILFVLTVLSYVHMVINVIRQLKHALGINCFSIQPTQPKVTKKE